MDIHRLVIAGFLLLATALIAISAATKGLYQLCYIETDPVDESQHEVCVRQGFVWSQAAALFGVSYRSNAQKGTCATAIILTVIASAASLGMSLSVNLRGRLAIVIVTTIVTFIAALTTLICFGIVGSDHTEAAKAYKDKINSADVEFSLEFGFFLLVMSFVLILLCGVGQVVIGFTEFDLAGRRRKRQLMQPGGTDSPDGSQVDQQNRGRRANNTYGTYPAELSVNNLPQPRPVGQPTSRRIANPQPGVTNDVRNNLQPLSSTTDGYNPGFRRQNMPAPVGVDNRGYQGSKAAPQAYNRSQPATISPPVGGYNNTSPNSRPPEMGIRRGLPQNTAAADSYQAPVHAAPGRRRVMSPVSSPPVSPRDNNRYAPRSSPSSPGGYDDRRNMGQPVSRASEMLPRLQQQQQPQRPVRYSNPSASTEV